MLWLLLAFLSAFAAFLEVTLQADIHHFADTKVRFLLCLCGIRKTWRLVIMRTPQGHRLYMADERSVQQVNTEDIRQSRGSLLLDALRRADKAHHFLLRHTHLDRLDALILLRTGDAARSSVFTGALQGMLGCIPAVRQRSVRIHVLPEFFREHTTITARCIIRLRLGTILLTAFMLLTAYLREQHLTESEAM